MDTANANSQPVLRALAESGGDIGRSADASARPLAPMTARRVNDIASVETVWRALTADGVESPGQSFDFIRLWIADRGIAPEHQCFVVGEVDGEPVALLPLHRRSQMGVTVYTWFPRSQVGCYAPISDYRRLAQLGPEGRAQLWQTMLAQLDDADAVYLRAIPGEIAGFGGLFDELGGPLAVDTLYRSEFASWEECDRLQRSRSRRKHDRQQGDRLAALGEIGFELVTDPAAGRAAIEVMFRQRSARFRAQGIRDTFVCDNLVDFYQRAMEPGSGLDIRLHVLRLNGEIVAVRYNVVHGTRMFCLISSMSDDPAIQVGSPGKQCLLRVMQTVFDSGFSMFDMGSGFTDEKRHWCNVQTPLRQHYVGLTLKGRLSVGCHQQFQKLRAQAKANPRVKSALRHLQQFSDRLFGRRQQPSD
ncbi:GNAT family N-acetyltransferase [Devosia sp.]|uniref:GNAT family N-acetyltransferase n=1 Tax=Devosia sp. TaxID=1871048 RepID=UPI001ACA24A6|nr:GNAT family N-acetyltransferase [Devosia sp.]MBN9332197.1 GNAT family N-acetyltransferase [Devosia sp.]